MPAAHGDENRLSDAEPLYRRALAIDEASFGPDHPNVARDLSNLARLLQATNRLSDAEPLYRRALAIDEVSFGPDHPDMPLTSTTGPIAAGHQPRTSSPKCDCCELLYVA